MYQSPVAALALYWQGWAVVADTCEARSIYYLALDRRNLPPPALVCLSVLDLSSCSPGHKPRGDAPFPILQMGTEQELEPKQPTLLLFFGGFIFSYWLLMESHHVQRLWSV